MLGAFSGAAMSTLAAARADNFYFPPDHDPRKGSLNKVRLAARCDCTCI